MRLPLASTLGRVPAFALALCAALLLVGPAFGYMTGAGSGLGLWNVGDAAAYFVGVSTETPGSHCTYGGARIQEQNTSVYACNGAPGAAGATGPAGATGSTGATGTAGTNGSNGVSVTSAVEGAGANCTNGGSKFTASNGITYACNGLNGTNGTNGSGGGVSVSFTNGTQLTSADFFNGLTSTVTTSESTVQFWMPVAGGFSAMRCQAVGADATHTVAFNLRVNGSDRGVTCTASTGAAVFDDFGGTVSFAAGALVAVRLHMTGAASLTPSVIRWSLQP